MREIRTVLMFVVLAALTVFALQNGSPILSLVFLGMKSVPLPLSIFLLSAFAAGVATSLVIGSWFGFSSSSQAEDLPRTRREYRQEVPRQPSPESSYRQSFSSGVDTVLQDNTTGVGSEKIYSENTGYAGAKIPEQSRQNPQEPVSSSAGYQERNSPESARAKGYDSEPDIDDDEFYEDWEEEEQASSKTDEQQRVYPAKDYEVKQQPKSSSWSGSMYSYSYRKESDNSEDISNQTDRTESVYDADYRVINLPPSPEIKPEVPKRQEDDWDKKKSRKDDW